MPKHSVVDLLVPLILGCLNVGMCLQWTRFTRGSYKLVPTEWFLMKFLFGLILVVGYGLAFYHELFTLWENARILAVVAGICAVASISWLLVRGWRSASEREATMSSKGA